MEFQFQSIQNLCLILNQIRWLQLISVKIQKLVQMKLLFYKLMESQSLLIQNLCLILNQIKWLQLILDKIWKLDQMMSQLSNLKTQLITHHSTIGLLTNHQFHTIVVMMVIKILVKETSSLTVLMDMTLFKLLNTDLTS